MKGGIKMESISFIKAMQQFFSDDSDGFGSKVEVPEFKVLSTEDKQDFHSMLLAIGIDCAAPVIK